MDYLICFIVYFVSGFIGIIQILMLIRAVMSWFIQEEGSRFYDFLYFTTEPVIFPVRRLLQAFGLAGDGMIIDVSFLVTVILLSVIQLILPTVAL